MLVKDGRKEGSPFFVSITKTPPGTLEEFLRKGKKSTLTMKMFWNPKKWRKIKVYKGSS